MNCLVVGDSGRFTAVLLDHTLVASGYSPRQAMDRLAYCITSLIELDCSVSELVEAWPALRKAWNHPRTVSLSVPTDLEQCGVWAAKLINVDFIET